MTDSGLLSLRGRPYVASVVALGSAIIGAVLVRLAFNDYAGASAFLHPHGYCYLWIPSLVTTHVLSDLFIGLSYVAIATTLVWPVQKSRRGLPLSWIFVAF